MWYWYWYIYYMKKPQEVINTIMTHWVGAGYGIMDSILTDNGDGFTTAQ